MTDLRLRAYAPNGASLGILPAPTNQELGVPLNDLPSLKLAYSVNAPRSELMGQPLELAMEVSRDGDTWSEPPGCRFLYLRDGRDPLKTADAWAVEAPGYGWILKKARLIDPGGWAVGGKRAQTSPTSVGFLMRLFVEEAQARGALAGVGITWTYTHDSAGVPWPSDVTGEWEMGSDYLAILMDFAAKGQVDWRFSGRDLQLYVPDTALAVDRTTGATQVHITPLASGAAPFRRTWEGVAGWIISRGEGDAHHFHTAPGTSEPWGRWEDYISNAGTTDVPTLQAYAEKYAETTSGPRLELTQEVEMGSGPTPLLDYWAGDYIWTRNLTGTPTKYRVRQITVTKESGPPSGNLVLNDRFVEQDIRTQRALEALTGGASAGGSTGTPPGADILPPAAPAIPTATPAYYMDDSRTARARVLLDWADVLTNMDGTALADLRGYEVWMKRSSTAVWVKATDVTESQAELSGFDPGAAWDFRTRAVDTSGNLSDYSPVRSVAMPTDDVAPATPSQPGASSRMGYVDITWDGENAAGNPMLEPDLWRVEAHASGVSGFTPTQGDSATMVGSLNGPGTLQVGNLAVGSTYYIRLLAVDTSLNASPPSVQRSVVVAPQTLDGLAPVAPGGWTANLAPLGIMALKASWPPVTNQDAVEYDVYLSTVDGFTTYDATTKVGATAGTVLAISAEADGSPLEADTTYYVKVRARDVDGSSAASAQGSAQPRQLTNTDVAADYVYAGLLEADQIISGDLLASLAIIGELATAVAGGRRVSLSSEGLTVTGQDGSVLAFFPTDASRDINLRADLVAQSITAVGPVAMRSALNELAPNAALVMGAASSAPVTPPNVAMDWTTVGSNTSTFADWFRGANYHAGSDRIYQAWATLGASDVRAYGSATGTSAGDVGVNTGQTPADRFICHTAARIGDYLYILVRDKGRSDSWYVRYYDLTATPAGYAGEWLLSGPGVLDGHEPAMTTDGTDLLFLVPFSDNVIRFQRRNRNTGALIGSQVTTEAVVVGGLWSMAYGAADVGATRVWFTSQQFPDQMLCYDPATGLRDAAKEFPSAFGEAANGLWYDTTRAKFRSKSLANNRIYQYDGQTWAAESSVWYVSNTWRDTDSVGGLHETDQGPRAVLTMKKRATLVVTTPPIPTDPNNLNRDDPSAVAVYVGRGDGTRTTQWRQSQPADGVTTVRLNSVIFSNADTLHPNPPAVSDFPAGTPGRLKSQDGSYYFDGNGDLVARTAKYATDVPRTALTLAGAWVNFGGGRDLASYEKVRGWVHLRGFIKSGSGTIATLPAGCRPVVDASPFNTETSFTFSPATSTAGNVLAPGLVSINPSTGVITFEAGANAWVNLTGIRFRAAS